jgi:hypothetical protein
MQVWSWADYYGSEPAHKVFIYLTLGEQTGYCGSSVGLEDNEGEAAPTPSPWDGTGDDGKWGSDCEDARVNSTLTFLDYYANNYSEIADEFSYRDTYSLSDTDPVNPCRSDLSDDPPADGTSNSGSCTSYGDADNVRVYNGTNGPTTLLFFNLGDGDVTEDEVVWAIRRVNENKFLFGIPDLTLWNMYGNFSNMSYSSCTGYTYEDHKKVHNALWNTDFGVVGNQYGATCSTDPDDSVTRSVPSGTWVDAF